MTSVSVKAFRGKVPRSSERLLAGNFAVEALNCRITSGRLDPIRGPALSHSSALEETIASMWRYRNAGIDYWMVWPRIVDAVRSPTAQDTLGRSYWTGDGEPRMAAFDDAISGGGPYPAAWYVLGVYIPTVAPTLGTTGGSGTTETRSYVYTLATQYGEESAPSPAGLVTGPSNATSWNLSNMEAAPPNSGTVTAATVVSAGVVEVTLDTARGLAAYEEVTFAGVVGMTDLNDTFALTSVDLVNKKVRIALTTAQTYTSGGTWARAAPHNLTGMKRRIYRTVGTNTDYKFVAEIPVANTTYTDTVAATALGGNIPTLNSFTPPKNGHSLVALANGALAMLAGNELCISEQYKPYSWPLANRYAFAGQGVALCAAGNAVIVLTDAVPVVATATVPEATSLAYLEDAPAPCIAKTGVVDTGGGAAYPSQDGLWLVTPTGATKLTEKLYTQLEWSELNPDTFKAAYRDGTYYASRAGSGGNAGRLLMLDFKQPDSVVEVNDTFDALHKSPYDGALYVAEGSAIYEFDADDANRYLAFWQSGEYQLGGKINFACAAVQARYSEIVPVDTSIEDANLLLLANADNIQGAIGATPIGIIPIAASNLLEVPQQTANRVQFTLLRRGQVVFTKELNSSKPFRLPAGFKDDVYAVQVSASIPVYSFAMAQDMEELRRVNQ